MLRFLATYLSLLGPTVTFATRLFGLVKAASITVNIIAAKPEPPMTSPLTRPFALGYH